MNKAASLRLWELPDVLLFHTVTFLAAPTHRAAVLCHTIAPLCQDSYQAILQEGERLSVWDVVLKEDYGAVTNNNDGRRASKRLRRSPVHRVRDAHRLIRANTEISYFYLGEMTSGKTASMKLSLRRLCSLLDEYGPHLRLNHPVSSGGLHLVEVCRAKNVRESVILKCVQELVERRGALVDLRTNESQKCRQNALAVAAARGMNTVVRYLVIRGASKEVRSSGRFRLHANRKKAIECIDATPLEFAKKMLEAEKAADVNNRCDMSNLVKCVCLLSD